MAKPGSRWWYPIEIVGSVFSLGLIVYAAIVAILQADHGLSWDTSFKVNTLSPGGPAEQAGVQLGDQILAINAHPVDAWHLPVTHWRAGDTITVTLVRRGEYLALPVKLEPLSATERWKILSPLIIAFSFWLTSTSMPGLARQSEQVRLFRALNLMGSAALASGSLSSSGLIWAIRLFVILANMAAPLILHFHLTLPGMRLERGRRVILRTAYIIGAVTALPYALLGPRSHWWQAGWSRLGLRVTLSSALTGSLLWMGYSYVTTRSPGTRHRLRFVIFGTALGLAPFLLLSLFPDILGLPFVPYPFTMPALILIPIAYWYAIVRFDLLRVNLVLNRGLVYLSIILLLSGIYLFGIHLADRLMPAVTFSERWIGLILLVAMTIAVFPLRNWVQRAVDQLFYGGQYDYRSVVSDVSRRLAGTLEWHTLEELLLEYATETLWVHNAALLLPESRTSSRLIGRRQSTIPLVIEPSLLSLEREGPLARYLCRIRHPIETSQLQQEMSRENITPSERLLLNHEAIHWWVPMVSDGQLIGLLILGTRTGNERFNVEALQILGTLSDQIALAIKNILLLEELHLQLQETESSRRILEQMHQQLLIGREMERKHLARDLHDGPVQQLISLRYRLNTCMTRLEDPELLGILHELRDEASELLNELRGICVELRPPLLDAFGLASAIRAHSEGVGKQSGLKMELMLEDDSEWHLPETTMVSLFRVYQEALSNVIKHAHATQVTVRLYRSGSMVRLEIGDNGVGFSVPDSLAQFAATKQFGLLGIMERVDLLNGTFELTSQPDNGTRLCIQVPLAPC